MLKTIKQFLGSGAEFSYRVSTSPVYILGFWKVVSLYGLRE